MLNVTAFTLNANVASMVTSLEYPLTWEKAFSALAWQRGVEWNTPKWVVLPQYCFLSLQLLDYLLSPPQQILDILRISAGGVRRNAIKGLCSPRDRVLINETLQIMVSDETSTDDLHWFFEEFSGNPTAKRALWKTFKSHYSDLDRKAGGKAYFSYSTKQFQTI